MNHSLLVIGGNGFLGSAVCRAAVSRGWDVHSLSTSGRPPRPVSPDEDDPPLWTRKVTYHSGSALDPTSFAHLLPRSTAVVHSLGILLEKDYKPLLQQGGAGGIDALAKGLLDSDRALGGNPLKKHKMRSSASEDPSRTSYEAMNFQSAVSTLQALLDSNAQASPSSPSLSSSSSPSSTSSSSSPSPAPASAPPIPYVYISAEDLFRPFVPSGYIATKRRAEAFLASAVASQSAEAGRQVKGLVFRPGIMTCSKTRPLLTPLGPLLSLSASLPPILPSLLRSLPSSSPSPTSRNSGGGGLEPAPRSLARLLETRAMDVGDVGEAVCLAVERGSEGVLGVKEMEAMLMR